MHLFTAASVTGYSASASGYVITVLGGITLAAVTAVARYLLRISRVLADVQREVLPGDKPPLSQQVESINAHVEGLRRGGSDRLAELLAQSRRVERAAIASAVAAFVIGWAAGVGRAVVSPAPKRRRRGRF